MHLALLMSLVSALPTEAFNDHCVRLVAQPSYVVADVDGDGVDEQMTSAGAGCGSGFCGVGHDIRLSRDGTVVTTANDVSRFVMQQTLPIEPKVAALFPSPLEQALVVFGAFCSTPDPSLRATQQRRVSWVDGPPRAPERPYAWVSTSSSTCHGSAPCAVVWFGYKHGDAASWRAVGDHGGTTLRVTDRGGLVLVDEARKRHRWLYQYEGYARRVVARPEVRRQGPCLAVDFDVGSEYLERADDDPHTAADVVVWVDPRTWRFEARPHTTPPTTPQWCRAR